MSDFEKQEFHRFDDASNPEGGIHIAAKGEKVDDGRNKIPESKEDKTKDKDINEKNPHESVKIAQEMENGHRNLENQALKTEHPTPEELLAMAYISDKSINSDIGSAKRTEGVPVDVRFNA